MKSADTNKRADQAPTSCALDSASASRPVASRERRYGYLDCLRGAVPAPKEGPGAALFLLLMVGGMVTIMTTFNGVRHSGLSFFLTSHWLYPLSYCIAVALKLGFANRVAGFIAGRWIRPHLRGAALNVAMAVLNVSIMAPLMCAVVTLLLQGPDGALAVIAAEAPLSVAVAIAVNLLVVGPTVRLLYHNVILPATGVRLVGIVQRAATTWAGIFTG